MSDPLRVAAIGVGRIGIFHARHVQELAEETGKCLLVAVVDPHEDTALRIAKQLQNSQKETVHAFKSVAELLAADLAKGAVIASRTASS